MPKNTLSPVLIMDAVSLAADAESSVVKIQRLDNVGMQIDLTGSPTGSFQAQISNNASWNPDGSLRDAGTWINVGTAATVTAGSPDPIFIDLNQMSAKAVKLVYTRTSGTGTASVLLTGKAI